MGTVPKKKLTGKPSPGSDFDVDQIVDLTKKTAALADNYDSVLSSIALIHPCPQRVMRAAYIAPDLGKEAARFGGAFQKFALAHRLGSGGFIHESEADQPLLAVGFPITGGSISPKWKDEAFRLGRELATAQGKAFDEKAFEEGIRARYTAGKTSTGMQLTEVE